VPRRGLWLLLAGCAVLAAGCASDPFLTLRPEASVESLAALSAQTRGVPNHTVVVPTRLDGAGPVGIAVHELFTDGAHDRVIVMVHGVLSDHRTWRFVAGELARDHDLMLIDLPGAGGSDKPRPATLGPRAHSPHSMARRVLQAVEQRVAARYGGLDRAPAITLMGHSLGGAVIMRMFCDAEVAEAHAGLLSRVDSLVLISPLDINVPRQDPMFRAISEASEFRLVLGDATGLLRRRIADATRASVSDPSRALREEAQTRLEYLRDLPRRRAAQAMLRQAVPFRGGRPDWEEIEPVEEEYCLITLPALILWGRRDETLPVAMGYKLAAEMPGAEFVALPRVMHSPHIESPELTARLVRDFLQDPGAGAGLRRSADH
jgi:pimeloyl-ACP methyl ester carboxylesterase